MSKTLIFTATYNEKDNIKTLIEKLNNLKIDIDILVIDDKSPDGTWKILEELKKNFKNLRVILRDGKAGLDTAHKFAYQYAKDIGYENFISMDADLSHDPDEIPKILNKLDNNSFVIGSRYIKGGKCEMSGFRLVLSIFGNKLIKKVLGLNCNEFTTSYRGFNLIKLKNFNLNIVNSKGYSFFMETIYRLHLHGVKINEIPINFKNRKQGKSKIPSIEIFRTLKNLFFLYFQSKDNIR
ncbi:MAG: glycosyltransferase group 2 [Pelagibacteraceae bacterium TMED65]|nr:MAG: glycosyltransferase group 2 [Pelagibacteraceae bacterium TMED65]|tara:strand:+ start:125 stop:838 length:714 start_codon:yes stop_codon:yes gene_type:complete